MGGLRGTLKVKNTKRLTVQKQYYKAGGERAGDFRKKNFSRIVNHLWVCHTPQIKQKNGGIYNHAN